jgi:hypothetical protein
LANYEQTTFSLFSAISLVATSSLLNFITFHKNLNSTASAFQLAVPDSTMYTKIVDQLVAHSSSLSTQPNASRMTDSTQSFSPDANKNFSWHSFHFVGLSVVVCHCFVVIRKVYILLKLTMKLNSLIFIIKSIQNKEIYGFIELTMKANRF